MFGYDFDKLDMFAGDIHGTTGGLLLAMNAWENRFGPGVPLPDDWEDLILDHGVEACRACGWFCEISDLERADSDDDEFIGLCDDCAHDAGYRNCGEED